MLRSVPSDPFSSLPPNQKAAAYKRASENLREKREELAVKMQTLQLNVERHKLRSNLKPFVFKFWSVLEPDIPLRWNWHLDVLCSIVEDSLHNPQREIINVPPGTMKSLLMSVFARAWLWANNPRLRFLVASYSGHLSVRDNLKLRDVVTSEEYKTLFPRVDLTDDQNVKVRFDTTEGGYSIATSVGGPGTGEHPDYVIIDDPLNALQAESDSGADLKRAAAWIDRTLSTRGVTRGVRTWLVMQRLHMKDPTAHLLNKGGYNLTRFPMRYDPSSADARDARTKAGELLWPSLFPEKTVQREELDLGEYGTASQLQLTPTPKGGGLFKRAWFKLVSAPPAEVRRRVRFWDIAGTEEEAGTDADYTAGCRMSEDLDGRFYIEHAIRGRWSPADVDTNIFQTAQLDGADVPVREEKEGGGSGSAVVFSRARLLLGFDYEGIPSTKNKSIRARPLRAQAQVGNVYVVEGPYTESLLDEFENFPNGLHDDYVDACSGAFTELLKAPIHVGAPISVFAQNIEDDERTGASRSYWMGPT